MCNYNFGAVGYYKNWVGNVFAAIDSSLDFSVSNKPASLLTKLLNYFFFFFYFECSIGLIKNLFDT